MPIDEQQKGFLMKRFKDLDTAGVREKLDYITWLYGWHSAVEILTQALLTQRELTDAEADTILCEVFENHWTPKSKFEDVLKHLSKGPDSNDFDEVLEWVRSSKKTFPQRKQVEKREADSLPTKLITDSTLDAISPLSEIDLSTTEKSTIDRSPKLKDPIEEMKSTGKGKTRTKSKSQSSLRKPKKLKISLIGAKSRLENANPNCLIGRDMYSSKFQLGGLEHYISIDWVIEEHIADNNQWAPPNYYINDDGYLVGYYHIRIEKELTDIEKELADFISKYSESLRKKDILWMRKRLEQRKRTTVADFMVGYKNVEVPHWYDDRGYIPPDHAYDLCSTLWIVGPILAIDDRSLSFEVKEGNETKEIVITDIMPPLRSREFVEQLRRTEKKYERMKTDPFGYLRKFNDFVGDFVDTELLQSEIKWISCNTKYSIEELYLYYLSFQAGKYCDVYQPRNDIELFFILDHFRENCPNDLPTALFYFLVLSSNFLNVYKWRETLDGYSLYVTESDLMNAITSTDVNLKKGAIRYISCFPTPALVRKVRPFLVLDIEYDYFVEYVITDQNCISDISLVLDLFSLFFAKRRQSFSNLDLYPFGIFIEFLLKDPTNRVKEMMQASVTGSDSIKTTAVLFYTLVILSNEFDRNKIYYEWDRPEYFLEVDDCIEEPQSIIDKRFNNGQILEKRFIKCFNRPRRTMSKFDRWISCAFTLTQSKDYPLLIKETLDHLSF